MKHFDFSRALIIAACFATATSAYAQTNSIQIFGPGNVRLSTNGAGFGQSEAVYNSSSLLLSCDSAHTAKLSSTPDGTGNILVDNFINLTVTTPTGTTGPTNICRGGVSETTPAGPQADCFNATYRAMASSGGLDGLDPDTFANTGGVAPIDISSSLQPGPVQVKIDLVDTGGFLASSSVYLISSCTQTGVTGPATITGNPISQTNPPASALKQQFSFDSTTNQAVEFVYDLSVAEEAGQLSITNGTTPITSDQPLDPAVFQPVWVPGTSFATSSCLVHTGELLPNGQSACKLLTLQCQVGTGANLSGAQCPSSQLRNELFQDVFDGPNFTLPDLAIPNGPTFHQGVGFLMANEGWTGGPCIFDASSGLSAQICPQNLLTDFSGPGKFTETGIGDHPNSTFIAVAPVPEDLTTVTVESQQPGSAWINTQTPTVNFSSQPPNLSGLTPALPGQANFLPSPIQSITYGIALASAVPQPSPILLIPTDTVLTSPTACPAPTNPGQPPATVFAPPPQTVTFPSDGQFFLHYFAQDCAGTEELKFTQDATSSWSTSFFTIPVNIDTVTPTISAITLSPAPSTNGGVANTYTLNQPVTATYSCSDNLSGVVTCGTSKFAPGTLQTGPITSPVDTTTTGTKSFVVNVADAAGNHTTGTVTYQVVGSTVNLDLLKVAPATVRHNDDFVYDIIAINLGENSASNVVVTDPLPAGVTFLSATPQIFACTLRGCSNAADTHCSFANNTVTCTANSLNPSSLIHISAFTVKVVVRANASVGTKISNTASVSSANPDSNPGGNHSTATTRVVQ
jgi:uncharacterized repeat protein (TIGR01451 family)